MTDSSPATAALLPVPKCKGCGGQNISAHSRATVCASYSDPLGINELGQFVFAASWSGYGEGETWHYECDDCGRRMRLKAPPVEAPGA